MFNGSRERDAIRAGEEDKNFAKKEVSGLARRRGMHVNVDSIYIQILSLVDALNG